MLTFSPPTYKIPINPETQGGEGAEHSLWRQYLGVIPVGYSVLITSGTATTYPGVASPSADDVAAADTGSGEGGLAWFRGGIEYTITSAEKTILEAAGYVIQVNQFSSAFDGSFDNG